VLAQEIIRIKRDGGVLDVGTIQSFVAGITDGSVTDAQISAMAMAVFFKGLDADETVALTLAMRDSGDVLSTGRASTSRSATSIRPAGSATMSR
jgi:thymidine phosphorylase